jgi:hypothetical protein
MCIPAGEHAIPLITLGLVSINVDASFTQPADEDEVDLTLKLKACVAGSCANLYAPGPIYIVETGDICGWQNFTLFTVPIVILGGVVGGCIVVTCILCMICKGSSRRRRIIRDGGGQYGRTSTVHVNSQTGDSRPLLVPEPPHTPATAPPPPRFTTAYSETIPGYEDAPPQYAVTA